MRVTVRCSGQLRAAVGSATTDLELPAGASAADAVRTLAGLAAEVRSMVLDGSDAVQRTLVVAVGSSQVADLARHVLEDGDVITVLHPISGG